ncbi:MAG: hypothetical protein GEU90_14755 [Gemmatimonas sp.]|nr:hypothetical protein [Gemmatimonas sp.]
MRWVHAIRARLNLLLRGASEARMEEEVRFHLEREAEKNIHAGMSPEDARRKAAVAFGGREGHKEAMRAGRPFARFGGLWLDLKLGVRMLVKHPGLTAIGTLALAFAIAVATIGFEFFAQVIRPELPLNEGDRVVAIVTRDAAAGREEPRVLHDFAAWREELTSIEELGAFRPINPTLIVGQGPGQPVEAAEMTR